MVRSWLAAFIVGSLALIGLRAAAQESPPHETDVPVVVEEESAPAPVESAPASAPVAPVVQAPVRPGPISVPALVAPTSMASTNPALRQLMFQFEGVPCDYIIKRFAQAFGKTLYGEWHVDGTITFIDSVPYNYAEAFDLINTLIQMKGFELREDGRFLKVVPLSSSPTMSKILQGLDDTQTEKPRASEIVTVLLPLKYLDSDSATKAVLRMVSPFGSLTAMPRGRGLIITDRLATVKRIKDFLDRIDTSTTGADRQVRTYALKNASAKAVAATITELLGRSRVTMRRPVAEGQQPMTYVRPEDEGVTATADDRTNTLMLVGASDKLQLAEELIAKLDVAGSPGGGEVRIFKPKTAKAEELADTLRQTFAGAAAQSAGGRSGTPAAQFRAVADPATNRLIVSASIDTMTQVERLIEELDGAQAPFVGGARIVPLTYADAAQLAPVILQAVQRRDGSSRSGQRSGAQLTIAADPRSNSLILSGAAGDMQAAEAIIKQLDVEMPKPGEPGSREIHVVRLKAGDATKIGPSLVRLFQQQALKGPRGATVQPDQSLALRVEADAATNSLIISSTPGDWPKIEEILNQIEKDVIEQIAPVTRLVRLEHAKATEVATTLKQIYDSRSRSAANRPGQAAPVPVVISPSESANSLLISAGGADQEAIGALLKQLDVEPTAKGVDDIQIVQLQSASAEKVASTLRAMMPPSQRGQADVSIQGDPLSNTVLIRAPQAMRAMLEGAIKKLDTELGPMTAREMRTISLKNVTASSVIPMLNQLYGPSRAKARTAQPAGARSPSTPADEDVVIAAAPGDRAIVVDAPKNRMDEIAHLVAAMDTADTPGKTEVRTYALVGAAAPEVAASLTRIYAEQRAPGGRQPAAPASTEPPPRFDANGTTNTLIVSATLAQFAEIEKTIEQLKAGAIDQNIIKTFVLKHAKAEDIAPVLDSLLGEGAARNTGGRGGSGVAGRAGAKVASVPAANTVIVQGPPDKLAMAEELIKGFDVEGPGGLARQVRIYQMANSDASEVAKSLGRLFAEQQATRGSQRPDAAGQTPPRFEADTATNNVIAFATADQFVEIDKIVQQLQKAIELAAKLETITLKHARAEDVAPVLEQMLSDTSRPGQPARSQGPSRMSPPVRVVAVPGAKVVMIQGPPDKLAQAHEIIATVDTEDAQPARLVKTYQFVTTDVVELAKSLGRLFAEQQAAGRNQAAAQKEPAPRFEADSTTHQLMVQASAAQFAQIDEVIGKLQEKGPVASQTRTFVIENAKVDDVAAMLNTMLPDLAAANRARGAAQADAAVRVSVMPPKGLVVQAPPDKLAMAEQLIKQFDKPEGKPVVMIVPLKAAEPVSLAQSVNQAFAAKSARQPARGGSTQEEGVTVVAETNSNSVLVRGNADDVAAAVEMIRKLDDGGADVTVAVRTFPLKNSDAFELVKPLNAMFGDMVKQQIAAKKTGGRTPSFSVAADTRTNSLIVSTTPAMFALVTNLLAELDKQPETPNRDMRFIVLANADAWDVSYKLDALYKDRRGPDKPVIEADSTINGLTIIGKTSDLAEMEPIIERLDKTASYQMRVVPLNSVRAEKMAQIIQRVYGQMTDTEIVVVNQPAASQPAGRPLTEGAPGPTGQEPPADGAVGPASAPAMAPPMSQPAARQPITLAVDKASNSLIISASRQEMERIQSLVDKLSIAPPNVESDFRIFEIKQADPFAVAKVLEDLFNPKPIAVQVGGGQARGGARGGAAQQNAPGGAAAAPQVQMQAQPPAIVVVADSRTRSLIIRAKNVDFDIIAPLITHLDQKSVTAGSIRVFVLKNADATEVASNLRELFTLASQRTPSRAGAAASGTGSAQQSRADLIRQFVELRGEAGVTQVDISSQISVSANRQGNTVIVTAPPDAMDLIAKLVEELDQSAQTSTPVVRLYPVKNADVAGMVAELQDMFGRAGAAAGAGASGAVGARTRGGSTASGAGRDTPVVISGDEQARLVLVSASAEMHPLIQTVISELDKARGSDETTVKVYRLLTADATTVATALTAALASDTAAGAGGQTRGGAARRTASAGTLRISADRSSNSIVVRALKDDHDRITQLLAQMDVPQTFPVQTIVLKNADAEAVAATLTRVFGGATAAAAGARGARGASGAAAVTGGNVVIAADRDSKMLFVRADEETFAQIKKMAADLDISSTGPMAREIFPLKFAQAATVAPAIQAAFPAARGAGGARGASAGTPTDDEQVTVVAEPNSNSIIVTARAEGIKKVQSLLEKIDVEGLSLLRTEIVMLKNAKAADAAAALTKIAANMGGPRAGSKTAAGQGVAIAAAQDANAILINGPATDVETIKKMAAQLDLNAESSKLAPVVIALKNAQAASVAPALQAAFTPQKGQTAKPEDLVTIVAEAASNSIVVTASAENLKKVQSLLAQMDTDTGGTRSEFVVLKNAKAKDLETVLSKVVANMAPAVAVKGGPQQKIVVSGDPGSNALVLNGPAVELDKLKKMAMDLDQAATDTSTQVYIIALATGDALTTAAMVKDLYNQQKSLSRTGTLDPLAVTADQRANALVLATSKPMYDQVQQWVTQVEAMKPTRGPLRMITLEYADPSDLQRAIQQMYGGVGGTVSGGTTGGGTSGGTRSSPPSQTPRTPSVRPGPRGPDGAEAPAGASGTGGAGGRVETSVLPAQRAVIIDAADEDFARIQELAKALDEEASRVKREVKILTLKNANPTQVADSLTRAFTAARTGVTGRPEDQVTVTALPQTNAIVVTASKDKMEEVKGLIEQLDKQEVAPPLDYRIYPLTNTSPSKILPMLRQLLADIQRGRPGETISVQGDDRSRSLIVTARGAMFDQVEKIIRQLDQVPPFEKAEVLIVPLRHADAAALATVLNDMLRPSGTASVTPEAKALQEQIRLLRVRSLQKDDIPELDLNQPIKVTADSARPQGSNALVITSTPSNLKAMQAIVEILDTVPVANGTVVRVKALRNADAQTVVTIIKDMFTQGQQLAGKPGSTVEKKAEPESVSGKGLVNPLAISADLRTNSVIMCGIEETVALAEAVVTDLDKNDGKLVTEVRAFKLKNADAKTLAPILQAVFGEGTTTGGAAGAASNAAIEGARTQASRLQVVLDNKGSKSSTQPKLRPALSIQADPTTNILLVAARADLMPLIAEMIQTMDIPGAGSMNTVRFYPLNNADATRLQTVLSTLYTGPNAKFVRDEDKPNIAVDTRTNALVISASDKTFAVLENLLKQLDTKLPIDLRDIRLLPLKSADAAAMATTLQKMMDARVQRLTTLGTKDAEAMKMIILADVRSNSLMIGGSAEGFELTKSLAEQLDGASPALVGQIQIFPLTEGNAGVVGPTLQNLFNQRYATAQTPDIARQKPIILADVRTNSLLVAANADDTKVIESLLKRLDVKLLNPSVQLVVIPLTHNDATVVASTIRTLFQQRLTSMTLPGQTPSPQDRVDVAADTLSNAMIVSASKENLELIKGLLDKIDREPPPESGLIQIFVLKKAEPSRVASLLQSLVSQGLYKPSVVSAAAGQNAALAAREKIAIVSDERTGALIVSASKENMAVLEQIIKQVDTDVDLINGTIRVYSLKKADASRLAPVLQQFFSQKRTSELAVNAGLKLLQVVVTADARTNTLLVTGGKEDFASVEDMLKKLDGDDVVPLTDFRIFPLKRATASIIAPTLQQLLANRVTRPGVTKDPVTVLADPRSNSLIVGASPEDIGAAEALIIRLDAEPDVGMAIQIFPLAKADAAAVAKNLQSIFTLNGKPTLTATVDERTNAIIVSAGETDMARVKDLISRMDGEAANGQITEIRVFTLLKADATEMAALLTNILTKKPTPMTTVSPNRQALLQFVSRTREGQDLITSALQEGVLITADRRSNSLVITAAADNMPLLSSLIEALDSTEPRGAEIRVLKLVNADARTTATVLAQLFRATTAGTTGSAAGASANAKSIMYTLSPTAPGAQAPAPPANGQAADAANIGSAEQDALTITVDARTNSLLVGGTKHYVDLCEKVVQELDSSPAQERVTQVVRLRNARASDVQTALRAFLDQETQRIKATLPADALGAAQQMLEREVAVVSVGVEGNQVNSTTLLLSASPRYFKVVDEMIKRLDEPSPQVLIQVLLAEVTLDNTTELGFEWNLTKGVDGNTIKGGTSFGVAAKNDGFTFSVTGGDLNLFLRALQSQGRLEVLSRPQILAGDNQPGTINVGQRVPLITESRVTDQNTTISTITYEDVGIKLAVTPRINPDGFVKLLVAPEISSLSSSSVDISPGVKAPIINSRQASTTLTVQDGHTIIIGGLITTKDDTRETKVPILGDIPVLGLLFKSTTVVKERTELLIILTPRVLRSSQQVDTSSAEQLRQLNKLRQAEPEQMHKDILKPCSAILDETCPTSAPASEQPVAPVLIPGVPPASLPGKTTTIGPLP